MKFKAEITRRKDGVSIDTPKTFKDFDTAACYIANRSRAFVPFVSISASFGMVSEDIGNGVTTLDFGSDAYIGRITEVSE